MSLAGSIQPPVGVAPKKQMHVSPLVKPATVQMTTAKSSFVASQPVTINYCTIVYDNTKWINVNGIKIIFYPKFNIDQYNKIDGTHHTIMSFTNGTSNIRQGFSFTNQEMYFTITYN